MKTKLYVALVFFFSYSVFLKTQAQEIVDETLEEEEQKILLNREFTSLLSDIQNNAIGNYASINIGATQATFSTSVIRDHGIWAFRVSGASTDGSLNLVNNGQLNYNLSFGFQHHLIDRSKPVGLVVDVIQWERYKQKKRKIQDDTEKAINAIYKEENIKPYTAKKKKLEAQLSEINISRSYQNANGVYPEKEELEYKLAIIQAQLDKLQEFETNRASYSAKKQQQLASIQNCFTTVCDAQRIALNTDKEIRTIRLSKGKLEKEKQDLILKIGDIGQIKWIASQTLKEEKLKASIKKVQKEIDSLKNDETKEFAETLLRDENAKKLRAHMAKSFDTYGSKFNWFSLGANINRKTFNLLNKEANLSEQLMNEAYTSYDLTVQYSWHRRDRLEKWKSYLVNVGGTIRYTDNLSSLSLVNFENQEIIGSDEMGSTRVVKTTSKAYSGEYQKDISSLVLFTDIYYFIFGGNTAALHLYPNAQFSEGLKPLWNTEIGLLFTYKNAKKEGAFINAELFYRLQDLGNRAESELSLLSRNTIGLRLTLPIEFTYNPN